MIRTIDVVEATMQDGDKAIRHHDQSTRSCPWRMSGRPGASDEAAPAPSERIQRFS
ncbi:hypothetical protein [Nesterenkonia halophila]